MFRGQIIVLKCKHPALNTLINAKKNNRYFSTINAKMPFDWSINAKMPFDWSINAKMPFDWSINAKMPFDWSINA